VKNPPTSTTTPYVVAPVTLTSTFSSTDPSGNVVIATVAIVSTPSPDSTQSGSGSGGPNTTAVIGGAVGGVVGLIALIGIIWFVMNKRRGGGNWDDAWGEDEGHQAATEVRHRRLAAADYGLSPNHGVGSSGTPSPLLRGDQLSGVYSHSRNTSTTTGYASHGRSNSQTPFMLATSPPHSLPHSPPSLQQQQPLPGAGAAGLERTRTPPWASPSEQQRYFHQGHPSISSDPNFTPTVTSTYSSTSYTAPTTASSAHTHTTANPAVAYPPGAAPPITGGRRSTYNEDHRPPLEQSQHGSARQPPQHQQYRPSSSTAKFVNAPIDNLAKSELAAVSPASVHTPSIKDRRIDNDGLGGAPTSQVPRVVEDAPPAYAQ